MKNNTHKIYTWKSSKDKNLYYAMAIYKDYIYCVCCVCREENKLNKDTKEDLIKMIINSLSLVQQMSKEEMENFEEIVSSPELLEKYDTETKIKNYEVKEVSRNYAHYLRQKVYARIQKKND